MSNPVKSKRYVASQIAFGVVLWVNLFRLRMGFCGASEDWRSNHDPDAGVLSGSRHFP